jgi:transcriptional regulator with XRE-family HTH domain
MYLHDRHRSAARKVLGDLLRSARQARGISQSVLEEWSGVDQTVISRLENGRPIGVRLPTLLRLFDALGIERLEPAFRPWHPWSEGRDEVEPPAP